MDFLSDVSDCSDTFLGKAKSGVDVGDDPLAPVLAINDKVSADAIFSFRFIAEIIKPLSAISGNSGWDLY